VKTTLDRTIETALAGWPAPEKEPGKEQQSSADAVTAIMKRIEAGDMGTTAPYIDDERIFSVPLGQDENPSHNWSGIPNATQNGVSFGTTTEKERAGAVLVTGFDAQLEDRMSMTDRERDRKSLQDLMAMAKNQPRSERGAGEAKGEDSGLIRLASFFEEEKKVSETVPIAPSSTKLGPASAPSSAPATTSATLKSVFSAEQVEQAIAEGEAAKARAAENDRASIPPVTPTSVSPAPMPSASARPTKKDAGVGLWLLGGGAVAGVAAAAAAVFYMLQPTAPIAKVEAKEQPVINDTAKRAGIPDVEPPSAVPELPPVEVVSPAAPVKVANNAKPTAAPQTAPQAAPREAPVAQAAKLPEPPPADPAHATGTLAEAMRQAAGPAQTAAKEENKGPEFAAGTVPQKPSQGALTGAIGAALPSARACLGPDDPVSRATITFTSNGAVQSVAVHGGALGTPAEGCIKNALSKAKISPFAEATYTTTVTVRH